MARDLPHGDHLALAQGHTTETTKTAARDTLTIPLGYTVVGTWSNLTNTHGWKHLTVHTALPAGHTSPTRSVTMRIDASENSTRKTSFVVDDVSLTTSP